MKQDEILKSRKLRSSGKSIKDIAQTLGVSSSSVSRWCSDIKLSDQQIKSLENKRRDAGVKALTPWIERNKKQKIFDLREQAKLGTQDLGSISKRDLFVLGLGLYWGEGYKRGSQECGFTNSDPHIIRTVLSWFQICYNIELERISATLTINNLYREKSERIHRYWIRETGIPKNQFMKPTFIDGYGGSKKNPETYVGTLRIKVRRGTSLRRRILASIEALAIESPRVPASPPRT